MMPDTGRFSILNMPFRIGLHIFCFLIWIISYKNTRTIIKVTTILNEYKNILVIQKAGCQQRKRLNCIMFLSENLEGLL